MANDWFKGSCWLSRGIFFLIVLYFVCAILFLLLAFGVVPNAMYHNPNPDVLSYAFIGFAAVSFVFTVLISAFHLSTLIRRRKRKDDLVPSPAA